MAGKSIARVGAAAVVLGLSVAGPHAGIATADTPDPDPSTAPADGSADPKPPTRSHRSARTPKITAGAASSTRRAEATRTRKVPESVPEPASSTRNETPRPTPAAASAGTSRGRTPTVAAPSAATPAKMTGARRSSTSAPPTEQVVASALPAAASSSPIAPVASASAASSACSVCLGATAPTLRQAVGSFVNHLFNSTFNWLSNWPGGLFSDLVTGALVLVRRSLFLVPEGVTATQTTNGLTVTVNTGSTAYFRQDGTSVQVSGDPRFWGAKDYTLSADKTVAVSNPGNAGCAGFVFTSGTAAGSLATTQIDSIRFEGDSAFAGRVDAAVLGRPLTLRDAVRGLKGVSLDAVVVLGNDVSVDAGTGDALFLGTVDGTKSGKQSLSVTALGTTVFVAPVGSVTPLESLLTQGIAPLKVVQSGDSKTIPLHFLPEMSVSPPTDASPGVKYGIDVAIGNNASQIYEFDTGGTGFFAGYNQPFWVNVPLTTTPASEVYNSGNYFDGVVSNTKVTLGRGDQTVSTDQPIAIGAITAGGNSKTGKTFDFTNPAGPPVQGRFFGDFGASLAVKDGLTSPLVQLPGNLASGFLVQIGPIGVTPQLTVGVTEQLRDQFPYAIPVIESPTGGNYPTSGYPILDQFGFAPAYSVTLNGTTEDLGTQPPLNITCATSQPCLPTLIDSGAPTTGVRLGQGSVAYFETPAGTLTPGTAFTATFPTTLDRPVLTWEFIAGDNPSVNQVKYQQTQKVDNPENVNVGLTLYNYYDVMFDVEKKTIFLRPTGAQSNVLLNSVTTTGDQTYRENAQLNGTYTTTKGGSFSVAGVTTLDGDTVVTTGSGDVTFSGTVDSGVDGASSLSVNSTGATNFVRVAGTVAPLKSLTTDAGGTTATAGVITSGSQAYGDAVSLSGLYSVGQGSTFSVDGPSTLTGSVSVLGGDITFDGALDSQRGSGFQLGLTPGDSKTANINGAVGSTNPLGGLELNVRGNGNAAVNVNSTLALQGNLGYSSEKGLDINSGVTATFDDVVVIQNFSGAGVIVDGANPLTISGFIISGNGKEGIQVVGAQDVTIIGNNIAGNGTDGINVDNSSTVSIDQNVITNNQLNGVLVNASKRVDITDNTIAGSGSDGIEVVGGQDHSIAGNTITTSSADGVYLDQAVDVTIVDNAITGNGLQASNSSAVAGGGKFEASGVHLNKATNVSIEANVVSGNGVGAVIGSQKESTTTYANGIYAVDSTGVNVTAGNTIAGNGVGAASDPNLTVYSSGISSDNSTPVTISGNTISGNGSDGVEVKVGVDNSILGNSIFGNRGKGIALVNGGNNDQSAPKVDSAVLGDNGVLVVKVTTGSADSFELQVFYSPATDAPNVQGRELIYTTTVAESSPAPLQIPVPSSVAAGGFITATLTPNSGAANTSKFSDASEIVSGPIVVQL